MTSRPLLLAALALGLSSSVAAQTTHTITQSGSSFSPANLTIDEGDSVRWVWTSGDHTVTEGPGPIPVNAAFDKNLGSFNPLVEVLFDQIMLADAPRTDNVYQYFCVPHWPGMVGSVTVRELHGVFVDASQVVPPTGSAGFGDGLLSLDLSNNELSWDIDYGGLSGAVTAAHFHGPAALGQIASPVISLGTGNPLSGAATLTAQQVADLQAGLWYVNLHTAANPDGEIRGQLLRGTWTDVGGGTASVFGAPTLRGSGPLTGLSTLSLDLHGARQNALMLLWLSLSSTPLSIFGGTIHAFPFTDQVLLGSSSTGSFSGGTQIPPLPPGTDVWFQFLIDDSFGTNGITLSNGLRGTAP